MRYRFSDADRERLGITEEWTEFDPSRLMFDEAMSLEAAGYDVEDFLDDIRGHEVLDDKGEPVMVSLVDDDGSPVLDDEGQPKKVPARRVPLRARGAAMWTAARRGGSKVSFADFTFDMAGIEREVQPEGKDDSPDPASGS